MVRRWAFWLVAWLAMAALATEVSRAAEDLDTSGGRLVVDTETLPQAPYEQEMVLITIRGFYPFTIALSELRHPSFRNFGWMQLGRDRWFEVQGQQMRGFERTMAVFPQRAGRLTIEPFVHHLADVAPMPVHHRARHRAHHPAAERHLVPLGSGNVRLRHRVARQSGKGRVPLPSHRRRCVVARSPAGP